MTTTLTAPQMAAFTRLQGLGFTADAMGKAGPMMLDVMRHRDTGLTVIVAYQHGGFELYIQSTIRNSTAATWTALDEAIAAARSVAA